MSPPLRRKRLSERVANEADRRFGLLVAMMIPNRRAWDRFRSRASRDRANAEPRARAAKTDRPALADSVEGRHGLDWPGLSLWLFAGCVVLAVLFIAIAALATR